MNGIREIALSFCASAVFCAGAGLIKGGVLEKSGRYIIALVMLCSIVSVIAGADFSFSLPNINSASAEAQNVEEISGFAAEQLVGLYLSEKGAEFEKITATVTKNDENGIVISELLIEGATSPEEVERILIEAGIDCRVVFG